MTINDPRAAEFYTAWAPGTAPDGRYGRQHYSIVPVNRLQVGDTFGLRSRICGVVASIERTPSGKSVRITMTDGTVTTTPVSSRASITWGWDY